MGIKSTADCLLRGQTSISSASFLDVPVQVDTLAPDVASGVSQTLAPASMAVRASARLTLPAHSAGELPEISHAAYMAASMLRQHIASLQPQVFKSLGDTSMTGEVQQWMAPTSPKARHAAALTRNVRVAADLDRSAALRDERISGCCICLYAITGRDKEANIAGTADLVPDHPQDLPGEQLDVRERIYDMVRPLDWMQEAPEPPGMAVAVMLLSICVRRLTFRIWI